MSTSKDLTGKRFNRLVVLNRAGSNKHKKALWNCLCDCGGSSTSTSGDLNSGHTGSCGCYNRDICASQQYKHGLADHPLYRVLIDMEKRCYNESHDCYRWYGAKGVTICDMWRNNPAAFVEWGMANGYKKGLSIDRIKTSKNYSPDNCQFITVSENTKKMIRENYRDMQTKGVIMNHPYPHLKEKYNHLLGRFIDIFRDCTKREKALKDLILHCWLHSGYENCGYMEMTTKQKNLYDLILKENEREIDIELCKQMESYDD